MRTVSPLFPPPSPLYLTVLNASTKTPGLLEVCTHIVAPLVLCGTLIYELSLKSQGITLEKIWGHLQHLFDCSPSAGLNMMTPSSIHPRFAQMVPLALFMLRTELDSCKTITWDQSGSEGELYFMYHF